MKTKSLPVVKSATTIASLLAASSAPGIVQVFTDGFIYDKDSPTTVLPNLQSGFHIWDLDPSGSVTIQGYPYFGVKWNGNNSVTGTIQVGLYRYGYFAWQNDSGGPNMKNLALSETVSAGKSFAPMSGYTGNGTYFTLGRGTGFPGGVLSGFTSGEKGYMGFVFKGDGILMYGWAEVIFTTGGFDNSMEITQWAFQDDGSSIQVGEGGNIPEPTTAAVGLAGLALGAAGLRRWRKAKQAA